MVQISERKKTHQLISPINTDHVMFIWRGKPVLSFSKSYQNTEIAKYFGVKCYCIIRSIYVFQVTPSLTWIGIFFSFFVQDCFYTELLMFDTQYEKWNNIYSTWKIKKGKIKNLYVVYLVGISNACEVY